LKSVEPCAFAKLGAGADLVLALLAGLDLLESRLLVLLGAGGELLESALDVEAGDALRGRLEVQTQRALDGDLVEAEVLVVEHLAHHPHPLDRLLGDGVLLGEGAGLAVRKFPKSRVMSPIWSGSLVLVGGVADACGACCRGFSICTKKRRASMSWTLPLRLLLAIGEHPDVGGDAGVVEELIRQGHTASSQSFSMIQLADIRSRRCPASPVKRGEPLKTMADAAAAFFRRAHLCQHVLEEQQRAVVDAGQCPRRSVPRSRGCLASCSMYFCCCFHSTPKGGLASM
jgi:hypothetical protein